MWRVTLFVNSSKVLLVFLAIFIIFSLAPLRFPWVEAQGGPLFASTQPVYAIWNIGGTASFIAFQLTINSTYYVWYQRPNDTSTKYTGVTFVSRTGNASFQIPVAANDPPGTYLVSLSNSASSDSGAAIAHFGVAGINSASYTRTNTMRIAGGGYVPNSTVTVVLSSSGLVEADLTVSVDPKGSFNKGYWLLPSTPTGSLTVSIGGSGFDAHTPVSTISSASVALAQLTITQVTQPPTSVERTSSATIGLKITYPDGSPVTTATQNATRVILVSETNGSTTELHLALSNSSLGIWTASWVPSFSAKLESFHFEAFPSDFNDSYGNIGRGAELISSSFHVTVAHTNLVNQINSTVQRTLPVEVAIIPKYHDGVPFVNVTQASGTITLADGTKAQLPFNGTLDEFYALYATNASTPLGSYLTVSANVADLFGNTASGTLTFQIVPAVLVFHVTPVIAERTTLLNATARITYPDGSLITSTNLPLGFNVTVSRGNFTWTTPMVFNPITGDWISISGYSLSDNQTLGNYAVAMNATDPYGNAGRYSGVDVVVPAVFQILPSPSSVRVSPHNVVYVEAYVLYPNGTVLTPDVSGVVVASITNSSGIFTYSMVYNSTDRSWGMSFTAPDPGLRFGLTLKFSFSATDEFGNAGSAPNAFQLNVSAGTETLILATIVGALPPIALIGWAIATVSTRRRKHKP